MARLENGAQFGLPRRSLTDFVRVSPTSAGQLSSKRHDVLIEPSFDYLVAVILV
jgi:hypothetical protein